MWIDENFLILLTYRNEDPVKKDEVGTTEGKSPEYAKNNVSL